jgi:hypothetical protein
LGPTNAEVGLRPSRLKADLRHLEGEFLLSENGDFVSPEAFRGLAEEDAYAPLARVDRSGHAT